ncbi:hypothetical protein SLEP1_g13503 [Rubroshorea leprosula]|uniref:Uncharacterized protein n=1 Tax=Rubroshorea leprosula TaxID=152421 RepID=A0AAV5IG55_9ROSI|nr:hypothetical protein SLEP1_g13503 [Rubroshorea leprosula]
MELALKERIEAKVEQAEGASTKPEAQREGSVKDLWKAFQIAFQVYTFTGGIDERVDRLTREIAQEIEKDPLTPFSTILIFLEGRPRSH